VQLTGPRVSAVTDYYFRKFDLDQPVFNRSNAVITRALQGGKHLTRDELGKALTSARIDANGLRLAYLIIRAELDAVICSGARRGKQFTYALLDERVRHRKTLERDEALAELTMRYFTGHGPALLQDFVWWSGLTVADAKAGLEMVRPKLNQEVIDGNNYWFGALEQIPKMKPSIVHLLPNYDEYLIAFKDRRASFDPTLQGKIGERDNALFAHIVVLNGQVIGGWQRTIKNSGVMIHANLLVGLSKPDHLAFEKAAERYCKFLKKPLSCLEVNL